MTIEGLGKYGMVEMDDGEIAGFLSSQSVGILGLSTDGPPLMRPMSFWFDGEDQLYFLYVLGERSRKEVLTEQTDVARFLVYRAQTPFTWTSVLLTGPIGEVPEGDREWARDRMEMKWRPDLFERASEAETTKLYRIDVEEQVGIKHIGLPPGMEPADDGSGEE